MRLDTSNPNQPVMVVEVGDRVAVVVPTPGADPDQLARVVSPIATVLAGEREITWPSVVIEREPDDSIGVGWVADDSDTVLAFWDVHQVGPCSTDFTLLLDQLPES